jgi:RNA polymerase sigma factor (sigma-70 family)
MNETNPNEMEERNLIELAATGDSEAVRVIVERHQAMVYGTCLRILGNEADAADAAQATFILFLKKCRKLKRDTVLGGWLYRTAGFVSREFIRTSARRKRREEQADIMNESHDQETTQVWNELKPELDEALMALPAKHRDVVVLRYLEGKSNDEAATTLGMTPSAVSTCLARALDKLRGHFQRRGIVVGTVVLSAALAKNASAAAVPAAIGTSVMAAAASTTIATAVSANVALMVQGALSHMAWVKTKVIALIGVLVTSAALMGIYGLQLSSEQIDALDFSEEQITRANTLMAAHRTKYLAIEKAHTISLRDEENFVKFEIAAFPDELEKLKESFWREFDGICDDRQERVARRYLVLKNLFPFGEYPVNIEIAYDGKRYSVQQRRTQEPDLVESGEESPQLDPRWKRFWGDREDATANVLESVLRVSGGGILMDPEALTFEQDQPVLTADFVDTLNLGADELVRVNQILRKMRQDYLAVEKKQLGKIKVTEDPDDTKHFVVPPFRSERKALDKKLWAELAKVLDARQLRLVKQSNGLRTRDSQLFDWGIATYSITIRKLAIGNDGEKLGYKYGINVRIDGGWWGPNGTFSKAEKQLPDKYRRLLAE